MLKKFNEYCLNEAATYDGDSEEVIVKPGLTEQEAKKLVQHVAIKELGFSTKGGHQGNGVKVYLRNIHEFPNAKKVWDEIMAKKGRTLKLAKVEISSPTAGVLKYHEKAKWYSIGVFFGKLFDGSDYTKWVTGKGDSESKVAAKPAKTYPSTGFTQAEGDAFRAWANSTEELKNQYGKPSQYDLDATGKPDNSWIRKAYAAAKIDYAKYLETKSKEKEKVDTPLKVTVFASESDANAARGGVSINLDNLEKAKEFWSTAIAAGKDGDRDKILDKLKGFSSSSSNTEDVADETEETDDTTGDSEDVSNEGDSVFPITLSGSFEVPKSMGKSWDALHSFDTRSKDGFGGRMNKGWTEESKAKWGKYVTLDQGIGINQKLQELIKAGTPGDVKSITIEDDTKNFKIKWSAEIVKSEDGTEWAGVATRGSAGGGMKNTDNQIKNMKNKNKGMSNWTEIPVNGNPGGLLTNWVAQKWLKYTKG